MMKKQHIFWLVLYSLMISASCKKFVDIPVSPQQITTEAIFTNENTAISAVDGVYTFMRSASPSFENGALSIFPGLTADELYNTSSSSTYDPFYQNAIPSINTSIAGMFWTTPYNTIYRVNAILEGLSKSTGISAPVKRQLAGEMKVVRALTYFYLINLYGDVPLITSTDYKTSSAIPRTPVSRVYEQIFADLEDAREGLTSTYPSTGKVRPNKQSAEALLARVYLYQQDWANAEALSSSVINSGQYHLSEDLNSVFLIGSPETIWEIASPSEQKNTAEGASFIPVSPTVKPTFSISLSLLQAFEPGDQRKDNWTKSSKISGTTYFYPYKYKNRSLTSVTEYEVVLRLSELYLIRAEAEANGAGNGTSGAVTDLNRIRNRAGLLDYAGSIDKSSLLTAIYQERRVELFSEWGHRWFDLKRSGQANTVLAPLKPGWQSFDALYPIPYTQVRTNPALVQNPGYQ